MSNVRKDTCPLCSRAQSEFLSEGSLGTAGKCTCTVHHCPQAPLSLPNQPFWICQSPPGPTCLAPNTFCQHSVFPGNVCLWYVKASTIKPIATQRESSKEIAHPAVWLWLLLAPLNPGMFCPNPTKTFPCFQGTAIPHTPSVLCSLHFSLIYALRATYLLQQSSRKKHGSPDPDLCTQQEKKGGHSKRGYAVM